MNDNRIEMNRILLPIILAVVSIALLPGLLSIGVVHSQDVIIRHLAWQPNGNKIALGSGPDVWLYTDNSTELWHIHETGFLQSLAWSPDGSRLALLFSVNERDWSLQVRDPDTQAILLVFGEQDIPLYYPMVRWNPNGSELAIVVDHKVQFRSATSGQILSEVSDFPHEITGMAWKPDGTQFVVASGFEMSIWDRATTTQVRATSIPEGIQLVSWGDNDTYLASIGGNRTAVTIWDSSNLQIVSILQGHIGTITDLAWRLNTLATSSNDRTIRLWDVSTNRQLQVIETSNQVLSIDWSSDGSRLVFSDDGTIETTIPTLCPSTHPPIPPTFIVSEGDTAGLISAITTANTNSDPVIISLTGSIYTLTQPNNLSGTGANGLPAITTDITFYGNCSTLERESESDAFRLFEVASEGSLTLYDVTLQGGDSGEYNGGAIYNQGTLILQSSTLVNNQGNEGGAIDSSGTATLMDTTIENNSAINGAAGGLYVSGGTTTITDSTLSSNAATTAGGALSSSNDSVVTITHSLLSGNSAIDGGAAFVAGSTFTLDNHTQILNNTASHQGGGLYHANGTLSIYESFVSYNNSLDDGGGIYSSAASVEITGSILTNNSSLNRGGAVYSSGSNLAIDHSSLYDNYAIQGGCLFASGTVTLLSADLSYNTAEAGGGVFVESGTLSLTDSILTHNSVEESGAGVYIQAGSVSITRGSLSDNTATGNGGAIYNQGTLTVTDGFITSNHADEQGGGVYNNSTASNAIQTTCISGNTATDISGVFSLTAAFDATNNWWGASDGPSGSGAGTGDAINANVNVTPFLTDCPH